MFRSALFVLMCCTLCLVKCTKNDKDITTSEPEWQILFDGSGFEGWKQYGSDRIGSKWEILDSMLVVSNEADAIEKNTGFGYSLMTAEQYANFELELEYRMSPGGNSGIMFRVQEDSAYFQDYVTGPEYQLLDDKDSPTESLPNRMTAALYDMYAPDGKLLNPAGEWNKVRIVADGNDIEHWLNGTKVLEYTIGSEEFMSRKAGSKWADTESWAAFEKGHISLQDHGDKVEFRNIRIRELK